MPEAEGRDTLVHCSILVNTEYLGAWRADRPGPAATARGPAASNTAMDGTGGSRTSQFSKTIPPPGCPGGGQAAAPASCRAPETPAPPGGHRFARMTAIASPASSYRPTSAAGRNPRTAPSASPASSGSLYEVPMTNSLPRSGLRALGRTSVTPIAKRDKVPTEKPKPLDRCATDSGHARRAWTPAGGFHGRRRT